MTDISNTDDIIDSRDIIERIEDLEASVLPWRAKMTDAAGIDRSEAFATHDEAVSALIEWLEDDAENRLTDAAEIEAFEAKAIDLCKLADGATWDGGVGSTSYNITIELNDESDEDEAAELATLKALAEEGENYAPDWSHGATLIRDSYFEEYAEELAADIGAINRNAKWPLNHIDWKAAAEALKEDYTELTFDGVSYWVR